MRTVNRFILTMIALLCISAGYSQSTGTYWRVDSLGARIGRDLPVNALIRATKERTWYNLTHTISGLQYMTLTQAIDSGWVEADPGGTGGGGCDSTLFETQYQADTAKHFVETGGAIYPKADKPVVATGGVFHNPGNGDVNGSGTLTSLDALYINVFCSGGIPLTYQQQAKADYNGDGVISTADAWWVQKSAIGFPDAQATANAAWRNNLFATDTYNVMLSGKVRPTGDTPFNVEVGGSMRLPYNDSLFFGGNDTERNHDTVCAVFKKAPGVLGIDGYLYLARLENSLSDTAIVDSAGYLRRRVLNFLTAETDPTIYSWAKSSTKPTYTYSEVGAASTTDSRLSDARPASDVYSWAKAATKPTYTWSEVGAQQAGNYLTGISTGTYSISVTGSSGSCTGNAATATNSAGITATPFSVGAYSVTVTGSTSIPQNLSTYAPLASPTFTGVVTAPNTLHNSSPGSNNTTSGTLVSLTATATSAIGDVAFVASTGKASFCKADAIANCPYCFAICADASISANAAGNWLTNGYVRNDSWSWTVGGLIYVSTTGTTGNTLTQTAPSGANNVVMPVAVALTAKIIYFYGNMTSVEHL